MKLVDFLKQGLSDAMDKELFMVTTLTFTFADDDEVTISVTRNTPNISLPFIDGGQEITQTIDVIAQRAPVIAIVNPRNKTIDQLVNTRCQMDSMQWRVTDIVKGDASVRFTLKAIVPPPTP